MHVDTNVSQKHTVSIFRAEVAVQRSRHFMWCQNGSVRVEERGDIFNRGTFSYVV